MKSLKNPLAALLLSLALAPASLAGIIHTPGSRPPEEPQGAEIETAQEEDYVSNSFFPAYAFDIMEALAGIF